MFPRTGERLRRRQRVRHSVMSATRVLAETVYLLGRLPAGRPLPLDQPILLLPRLFDVVLLLGLQYKRVALKELLQPNTHDTHVLLLDLKEKTEYVVDTTADYLSCVEQTTYKCTKPHQHAEVSTCGIFCSLSDSIETESSSSANAAFLLSVGPGAKRAKPQTHALFTPANNFKDAVAGTK